MNLPRRAPYVCGRCLKQLKYSFQFFGQRQIDKNEIRRAYSGAASKDRPFRLAVIGSGPAGFYAAGRVMRERGKAVVDMYERLPVPFGLVRYGVAPDHPEVKNCEERFEEIGASPNFNFIGNIRIGKDISLASLKPHYDAILFAYGASKDRELGIPGEHFQGVYSAREFVAWYNGLPGHENLNPKLDQGNTAVIIGQGNVALDVARVLLTDVDKLRHTDMPEYALETLSQSKIHDLHVVGRRGPMQAAFTTKEIREIVQMPGVDFHQIDPSLLPLDLKTLPRPRRRIAELLIKAGAPKVMAGCDDWKHFFLRFLAAPTSFNANSDSPSTLESITFQANRYSDSSPLSNPSAAVEPDLNARPDIYSTKLAFRSIGYKAEPLPGLASINVPFDDRRGIIPNQFGRVLQQEIAPAADLLGLRDVVPGCYVAGWVKRGPTGVIASTMEDAFQTADAVVSDIDERAALLNGVERSTGLGWERVKEEVESEGKRWTNWKDWKRIDEIEKERGKELGKPREKIVSVEEMLKVLDR